jgi:multiple sugar transport system ATP-binding protein
MTMADRIVVMKDGFIQQVDTPQNLYNKPCNLFVAGFIGSPQMNVLTATVEKGAQGPILNFLGFYMEIPKEHAARVNDHVGKQVFLGIRPENIEIKQGGDDGLKAMIEVAELMGSEMYIYCESGGEKLTLRTPVLEYCKAGTAVTLKVDPTKIHLFDIQTEKAI